MKRFFAGTAAILAAVLFLSSPAAAISAQKAIMVDGDTGRILYEKRANEKSLIASTTKIMTALLICEQCNVLDRMMIPKEAVGIEGSSIYLQEGEVLTLQDLLYGMMLHSGNDAATALAIYCGGTVEGFAQLMNDKARMLKMTDTHFVNPHGLDAPDHYSSARDLAILTRYAMKNPIFAQTVSTKSVRIGNRSLTNHNKLLWRVDGAEGVKTGYTKAAGRILVSSAQRQGRRLIVVTIEDGNDWMDHAALYEQGFASYQPCQIVTKGQILGHLQVFGGAQEEVALVAQEDFVYPLAAGEEPVVRLSQKTMVFAPVVEDADGGYAYICLGDTPIGKVSLRYDRTVEQQQQQKENRWHRWFGE
ncbi:MAG: D-alanyl-D-alanine carboxypeptidase [Oscillospiraceae bacterium]|nr:D-alanyl-D-alanine carboxypeptidase [Oscillospiraceae bacterium]